MDNINEIKTELDRLYKLYKKNKSTLNVTQTNDVVHLLKKLSQNGDAKDVAERLVVFSGDVCGQYFDELTKGSIVPLSIVESIINSYIGVNTDTSTERFYVKKYATMVIKVINNYTDTSYGSKTIAKLIALVAYIGLKSDKNMSQFERVVQETKGKVYLVDYSSISDRSLANVNKITEALLHNEKLKAYSSLISDWSIKYGFTENAPDNVTADNKVQIEESVIAKETSTEDAPAAVQQQVKVESVNPTPMKEGAKAPITNTAVSEKEDKPISVPESKKFDAPAEKPIAVPETKKTNTPAEKPIAVSETKKTNVPAEEPVVNTDKKVSNNIPGENVPVKKNPVQILYERLKRDMDKEQEAIITAFTNMITPVGKAFESIQGEINKSRELGIENTMLKAKNEELERQIAEMKTKLQENNQSFSSAKAENSNLRQQVRSLETKIAELDSKLNDAYSINSRESSLEAEKVRSELKKAFSFLYEDWLEYEFSDVSEENYESLQAIMKKIFRSLERNGIDFKGSNE